MTDRELLAQTKELYEKNGGLIIRFIDKEQKIHTWIQSNTDEGMTRIYESIPEHLNIMFQKLKKKAAVEGTAFCQGKNGELLFVEIAGKEDRLVICGAGYVGFALAKLAVFSGIRTIILEDRADFAGKAEASGVDKVLCGPFEESIRNLDDNESTAYVIMTRGHSYDKKCLLEIAYKKSYYVGMMGSKTRAAMIREELKKSGISDEWISQIHSPVGLDIGAQTPEEIAVSVLAEILLERSRTGGSMRNGYEVFRQALQNMEEGERFVLSTILERRGSAPRKEGTHFIVTELGKTFGTIGGGKLEADIIQASKDMLAHREECRIEESDLNNRDAASEGLVCGGHVKVLMETGCNR